MSVKSKRATTWMLLAGGVLVATAAIAGPSMSSNWLDITISQDLCVEKGQRALRQNSFTKRLETLNNRSIYGERGDYTALVRCASEKQIAYFVVAGPEAKLTTKYVDEIRDEF